MKMFSATPQRLPPLVDMFPDIFCDWLMGAFPGGFTGGWSADGCAVVDATSFVQAASNKDASSVKLVMMGVSNGTLHALLKSCGTLVDPDEDEELSSSGV